MDMLAEEIRAAVRQLEAVPKRFPIYADPHYWAGFVCYAFGTEYRQVENEHL